MLAQEIQKHIQTYKATPNTKTAFNTLYQNFQRLAETQVGNDVDQKNMLWFPHLSVRNNMMGNLFFPGELLSNGCSVYTLYFRGYIFLGLVFASKFGHPLAYHHLKKTLEMWIEDERIGESYWPLVERFQFKLNQIVNVCKDTINTRMAESSFAITSLLKATNNNYMEYLNRLVSAKLIEQDGRCCYELAWLLKDEAGKKYYFQKACELGCKKGYLGLASLDSNNKGCLDLCLKAEDGKGYFEAAKLLREMGKPYLHYFEKAGDLGYEGGYSALDTFYYEMEDFELAQKYSLKQAELGDRHAYQRTQNPNNFEQEAEPIYFLNACLNDLN